MRLRGMAHPAKIYIYAVDGTEIVPCVVTLEAASTVIDAEGGSDAVFYNYPLDCAENPSSSESIPWLEFGLFQTVVSDGIVHATLNFTVETNPTATQRSGVITVNDEVFTVTQPGAVFGDTFLPRGNWVLTELTSSDANGPLPPVGLGYYTNGRITFGERHRSG